VASRVRPELKKFFGSAAYVLAALEQALSYDLQPITVQIEGGATATGYFVVVGNARHYTRFFELTPLSDMADGLLDVSVFTNRDLLQLVKYALASPMVPPSRFPDVQVYQGSAIHLSAPAEVLAHVDCEILGVTPIDITTAPGALRLFTPPGDEKKKGLPSLVARVAAASEARRSEPR
jgi:diacylglycerol kinase (ATP)